MKYIHVKEEKEYALVKLKIDLISRYFPFTKEELVKYRKLLNFTSSFVTANENIQWDEELFDALMDKLNWQDIYQIKTFQFSHGFLRKYSDKLNFATVGYFKNLEWTDEIVGEFEGQLDWSGALILKPGIHTLENLRKYKDVINWQQVSRRSPLVKSEEIIDEFIDYWDWNKLSTNPNLSVSVKFIQKYIDKIDFLELSRNPASIHMIHQYPMSDKWNWSRVITNSGIHYTVESFEFYFKYYKEFLQKLTPELEITDTIAKFNFLERVFRGYYGNKSIFFEDPFIRFLQFTKVVEGPSSEVPLSFILEYKDKLNFKSAEFVRANKHVISRFFIKENLERFDTSMSAFYFLDIDQEVLKRVGIDINWFWLSGCTTLDWTWDFVVKYFDNLYPHRLSLNQGVYEKVIGSNMTREEIVLFLDNQLESGFHQIGWDEFTPIIY